MNWIEIALIGAVLVGVAAGTALVVRSPAFWVGLVAAMVRAGLPYLLRRMPPEREAEWRREQQAGRGDEWLRNRGRKRR